MLTPSAVDFSILSSIGTLTTPDGMQHFIFGFAKLGTSDDYMEYLAEELDEPVNTHPLRRLMKYLVDLGLPQEWTINVDFYLVVRTSEDR